MTIEIDVQRLRNLTTGKLHTEMNHIYEDLGIISGEQGLFTHMLPRVMRAIEPWLRDNVKDCRFWDSKFDRTHTGSIILPEPTQAERNLMFERYAAQPNPLVDKEVIGVVV